MHARKTRDARGKCPLVTAERILQENPAPVEFVFGMRAEHRSGSPFYFCFSISLIFCRGRRGVPRGLTNGPIEDGILAAEACLGDWFLSVIMHIEEREGWQKTMAWCPSQAIVGHSTWLSGPRGK